MKKVTTYLLSLMVLLINSSGPNGDKSESFDDSAYEWNKADGVRPWIDERDGQAYGTLEINGITWMVDNFNYDSSMKGVWQYGPGDLYKDGDLTQSDFEMSDNPEQKKYGRLYSYGAAQKLAPKGWRLPTEKEWLGLIEYLGWNGDLSQLSDKGFYDRSTMVNIQSSGQRNPILGFLALGSKGLYWASSGDDILNPTYYKKPDRIFSLEKGKANINCGFSIRYVME